MRPGFGKNSFDVEIIYNYLQPTIKINFYVIILVIKAGHDFVTGKLPSQL